MLVALVALLKQHLATVTAELLEAIAALALGALPVADRRGLVVRLQPKAAALQHLTQQTPLSFFLLKQTAQQTANFIRHAAVAEPQALLGLPVGKAAKVLEVEREAAVLLLRQPHSAEAREVLEELA